MKHKNSFKLSSSSIIKHNPAKSTRVWLALVENSLSLSKRPYLMTIGGRGARKVAVRDLESMIDSCLAVMKNRSSKKPRKNANRTQIMAKILFYIK